MFRKFGFRVVEQVLRKIKLSHTPAVCPGSEGAVLKIVGRKRLAGANPVHGVSVKLRCLPADGLCFS